MELTRLRWACLWRCRGLRVAAVSSSRGLCVAAVASSLADGAINAQLQLVEGDQIH